MVLLKDAILGFSEEKYGNNEALIDALIKNYLEDSK